MYVVAVRHHNGFVVSELGFLGWTGYLICCITTRDVFSLDGVFMFYCVFVSQKVKWFMIYIYILIYLFTVYDTVPPYPYRSSNITMYHTVHHTCTVYGRYLLYYFNKRSVVYYIYDDDDDDINKKCAMICVQYYYTTTVKCKDQTRVAIGSRRCFVPALLFSF